MTNCPECDAGITIPDDAVEGEIVTCAECGEASNWLRLLMDLS